MVRIELNPKVKHTLKSFREQFGKSFLHIPKNKRESSIKAAYKEAVSNIPEVVEEETESEETQE